MANFTYSNTKATNAKVIALETSLNQSLESFKDLVLELEQLQTESENYKQQYLSAKDKCENKTCMGAEELTKIITIKDQIIQSVASTLTKLNETRNFDVLTEAFKILFEEVESLTPPSDDPSPKTQPCDNSNKNVSLIYENVENEPKEAETSIIEDISFQEESVCEIKGTPTGRTSPIIQTRKSKSILSKTDVRDKKKCPTNWPTSDSKAPKLLLTFTKSTPKNGKLRQSRLNLVKAKSTTVVDLTCSPDALPQNNDHLVQPLIKKESMEYDDTILPSPTSEPTNFTHLKISTKASPSKFKKPKALSLKSRCENVNRQDENKDTSNTTNADMEQSINILNQQFVNRIREIKKEDSIQKETQPSKDKDITTKKEINSPAKKEIAAVKEEMESFNMEVQDEDETNASISLIKHVEQIEEEHRNILQSPSKRALAENINIMNTPPKNDAESSMSILRPEAKPPAVDAVKRKIPELVEPMYKEPTARKKAEKRNLQGWSCEECMNFYGILYKDDPVMLAKKINECSKHRGRHNPARPKTPPNFWNPRWHVPEDTEELNRMNNAT